MHPADMADMALCPPPLVLLCEGPETMKISFLKWLPHYSKTLNGLLCNLSNTLHEPTNPAMVLAHQTTHTGRTHMWDRSKCMQQSPAIFQTKC